MQRAGAHTQQWSIVDFREELFFEEKGKKRWIQWWGWWMCWWWHFDRGNFGLTGPRLSHESKCVKQALEMEGRSLWLWHSCEGLRLLGVKCDTSLGRCWFSVAAAQQTSSHGVWRGVWVRGWGAPSTGQRMGGYCSSCSEAVIWQLANHAPTTQHATLPPLKFVHPVRSFLTIHFLNQQTVLVYFFEGH